jgi:hypothetical protein
MSAYLSDFQGGKRYSRYHFATHHHFHNRNGNDEGRRMETSEERRKLWAEISIVDVVVDVVFSKF